MNSTSFPKALRHIPAVADIPMIDDNDDEDVHSDCSDDTTFSTWRTPPQDLRGNKYQNEMKVSFYRFTLTILPQENAMEHCSCKPRETMAGKWRENFMPI